MRPQGVIRRALREAAERLAAERGGANWREIASGAEVRTAPGDSIAGETVQRGVAPGCARQTIKNMVYAGELVEVGREKRAGSRHWQAIYAPSQLQTAPPACEPLVGVVMAWAHGS